VLEHHPVICENIRLNNINAELHSEGIGDRDCEKVVAYDKTNGDFGIELDGLPNKLNIKIKDVSKVIDESGADVAKIDCEGAEISLLSVSNSTLRKLEYVMIELHTRQIRQQLIEKFKNSGFTVNRDTDEHGNADLSIVHFKRKTNV
jgi:FkbM family methyltransferase